MDRKLAEEILRINLEQERITNAQYEIVKKMQSRTWHDICTEALKFMLEANNVKS